MKSNRGNSGEEKMEIILASGSPRRKALLESLEWKFTVVIPDTDEKIMDGVRPEELAERLAREKAEAVGAKYFQLPVVAADTVVEIEGNIFGKPRNEDEAFEMLSALQGRIHRVITGVALLKEGRMISRREITRVFFRKLDREEIKTYIDTENCLDKAGGYAIQGRGALLIEKIEGCYFNVVGLPLSLLSSMFQSSGWPLSEQWRCL
jgi:septum formation protein